ncbi:OFA family MFS transporter [Streptomonospora nanhaiensis]|uniref:MFS family permease n=1 Tax=Streptomonospora nanhaiensis TaxID=1323731 RepID=A0A853BHX6_9ACTN|nr:OFA family MFS transporter [Streptomonospora nanhaiensis]MBV2362448.1 OFA family MFS transporter [Streptomonospora nanhaiensis]MBX9390779.1 OFA family MFS transporter [Streptomonospora nanhaiensis]NYI94893.1 MFS family permease [Streptomonospora nanhaiensis]
MSALSVLDRERSVASWTYNRWLIPPAALAVHLSIGQAYATSVYKNSLVEHFDTGQTQIGIIFSIAIVMLGLSAAVGGTWVERAGPRKAMLVSALFWSGGFLVGALGIALGWLWLLYAGYGVLGGIGLGIGYISPVSTLMKWFPDRPGLATGMAIMGFGGGALVATPVSNQLMAFYDPSYDASAAGSVASGGAVVGLFATLGLAYLVLMTMGVLLIRVPPEGWRPAGYDPGTAHAGARMMTARGVSAANAVRTPQFWLLWVVLFTNVTAGIGILEHASPLIQDFFRDGGGASAVTAAAAGGFVGMLSLFNMGGRFVWSSTSDLVGRKPIYMFYLGAGAVLYLLMATVGGTSTVVFAATAGIIISFYGGGFATVPAYLRDLFGTYQVGAIHGRLLTAWSAAGIAGPLIINAFLDAQGEPGTLTQSAYQAPLLTMVGLLVVGFAANLLIRPVAERFQEPAAAEPAARPAPGGPAEGARAPDAAAPSVPRGGGAWLVVSWAVVAVLLGYAVVRVTATAAQLFTG